MSSTLTDREKDNLIKFWEAYNSKDQWLLDDPWNPSFGHSPANLIFTDEEDPAGCPDPFYYQAQGVEPPQESQEGFKAAMGRLVRNKEFCAFLGAVALFLVALAVFGN